MNGSKITVQINKDLSRVPGWVTRREKNQHNFTFWMLIGDAFFSTQHPLSWKPPRSIITCGVESGANILYNPWQLTHGRNFEIAPPEMAEYFTALHSGRFQQVAVLASGCSCTAPVGRREREVPWPRDPILALRGWMDRRKHFSRGWIGKY